MNYKKGFDYKKVGSFRKYFHIILVLFSLVNQFSSSDARFCDVKVLYKFGIKSLCESNDGSSVSCLNNPVKAYIQCESGYYSDTNTVLQTISCMENGQWSEQPIVCSPECIDNSLKIGSIASNPIQFPTSYVEVFEESIEGVELIKFSGLIIQERSILIRCEPTKGKHGNDFKIRIPKTEGAWEKRAIFYYDITRVTYNNEEFCILSLGENDNIKFDNIIKPSCIKNKINFNGLFPEQNLKPQYKTKCFAPKFEHPHRVEVLCFNYEIETFYEVAGISGGLLGGSRTVERQVDCSEGADIIILQCDLGYQNKKSKANSFLNKCVRNKWTYETENSHDCESVCGGIDAIYEPDSIPLLYKGSPVDILSAPWHVGIYTNNTNSDFSQVCGGTLIHSNIVISAGHCFDNLAIGEKYPASNYLVGAGKRYRKFDLVEKFQHFAGVKEIHTPQNYQSDPVRNDIAVLILDHHIEYTSHIKPVCVEWKPYNDYHVQDRVIGRLFGWGSTTLDDKSSGELLTIEVLTITNQLCKKMVHPNFKSEITGDRFCATNNANATACRGDSGGGFVIKKGFINRGNYYLLGVVSAGIDYRKYCSDGFITTFTNIQFFQDFLKYIIMNSRKND